MNSSLESSSSQSSTFETFSASNAINGDLEDYAQTEMESGMSVMFQLKLFSMHN